MKTAKAEDMLGRVVGFVVLAFLLSGCLSDQRRQASQCTLDARHLYSSADPATVVQRRNFAQNCMDTAGYALDMGRDRMCLADGRGEENPYCYVPKGVFGQMTLAVELFVTRTL